MIKTGKTEKIDYQEAFYQAKKAVEELQHRIRTKEQTIVLLQDLLEKQKKAARSARNKCSHA